MPESNNYRFFKYSACFKSDRKYNSKFWRSIIYDFIKTKNDIEVFRKKQKKQFVRLTEIRAYLFFKEKILFLVEERAIKK